MRRTITKLGANFLELAGGWLEVYRSGMYSEGGYVSKLEDFVGEYHGKYCVAFNSAGSGLFALYSVLQVPTWVSPTNTFYATAGMIKAAGRELVDLVDCGDNTPSIGIQQVINCKPSKGLVLTHVGGCIAPDYERIAEYCNQKGMVFIEDAAHALGSTYQGHKAGDLSTAAVFSLYPTKAIPVGEGGLVVTSDSKLAENLRRFRNYGKYMEWGVIKYTGYGFNLRMDEWTAVVAYNQFGRRDNILEGRRKDADKLRELIPPLQSVTGGSNYYKYMVTTQDYDSLGLKRKAGKVYQVSDQIHTIFDEYAGEGKDRYPNALRFAEGHECVPIGNDFYRGMSTEDILKYLKEGVS